LKIFAIEKYTLLILRRHILKLTGADDADLWRYHFLADRLNFGVGMQSRIGQLLYLLLSLTRYGFPLAAILVSLILCWRLGGRITIGKPFSWGWLFWFDIASSVVVFVGGLSVVLRAGQFRRGKPWITS
jgi:hypothetical protein